MNSPISSTDREEILSLKSLKAIILDFDGTIVDSEPVWKQTYVELFDERYGVELPMSVLWENTGGGVDLSITTISRKLGLGFTHDEVLTVTEDLHEAMHNKLLNNFPMRDGLKEFLEWAQSENIALAVCTASTHELIDQYFDQLSLRHIFSHVESTAVSDLDKRKPYPYPYLETMRSLGVNTNETIAVEDSPAGVTSARSAELVTIAIRNEMIEDKVLKSDPTIQLEDFHQVLAFVHSLQK